MTTAVTPAAAPALPERFANPLKQIGSLIAQPAVKRSLPLILMIGLIAAAGLAWMMLSTPPQRTLFSGLPDADKAAVVQALDQANIDRSEEHTSELQSLMRISYAVFCLKK